MNNAKARWLWGCLQDDFERDGLLDEDLNEPVGSMLEHMQATTLGMPRPASTCSLYLHGGAGPGRPAGLRWHPTT